MWFRLLLKDMKFRPRYVFFSIMVVFALFSGAAFDFDKIALGWTNIVLAFISFCIMCEIWKEPAE